jgi:hypothetical protein
LYARANNGSRASLSRNRRHDSRVHFRAYLRSLIVSLGCAVSGEFYSKISSERLDFLVFW